MRSLALTILVFTITIASIAIAQPPTTAPTTQEIERAVANDPAFLTLTSDDGLTVLHVAAQRGDAELVKRILELGGDPNIRAGRPVQGSTPLYGS